MSTSTSGSGSVVATLRKLIIDGHYPAGTRLAEIPVANALGVSRTPVRLALYKLLLQGGRVDFTDIALGTSLSVQDLLLSVPFISTLSDKKEVRVEPRLAFTLDCSRLESAVHMTPSVHRRQARATCWCTLPWRTARL